MKKDISYHKMSSKYNFPIQNNSFINGIRRVNSNSFLHSHSNYSDLEILEENIDVKIPYDFMKTNDKRNRNSSMNKVRFKV